MSITLLLVVLALLFTVFSMVWPSYRLLEVAVLLVCIVMLVGSRLTA